MANPYIAEGLRSAAYGALFGSVLGIGRAAACSVLGTPCRRSVGSSDDPEDALVAASSLPLDPAMLEAMTALRDFRSLAPGNFDRVVLNCDALVALWTKSAAGDEASALHPRMAAAHVACARRALNDLESELPSEARAEFEPCRTAAETLLSNYQHNISLCTMLYLPQGPSHA